MFSGPKSKSRDIVRAPEFWSCDDLICSLSPRQPPAALITAIDSNQRRLVECGDGLAGRTCVSHGSTRISFKKAPPFSNRTQPVCPVLLFIPTPQTLDCRHVHLPPCSTPSLTIRSSFVGRDDNIAQHGRTGTNPREPHHDAGIRVVCAGGSEALGSSGEACAPDQSFWNRQHLGPARVRPLPLG